jgi:hypothetical protein
MDILSENCFKIITLSNRINSRILAIKSIHTHKHKHKPKTISQTNNKMINQTNCNQ